MRLFATGVENQGRELILPPPGAPVLGPATPGGVLGQQTRPVILDVRTEDDDAVPITITIARTGRGGNVPGTTLPQPSDPQYGDAVVLVTWGAAGGEASAEIDVGMGTTFCLCASKVRVAVLRESGLEDFSQTIVSGQPNESTTILRAWAAYGTTPCAPPMRSAGFAISVAGGGAALAPGNETARFRLPAFARRAYVIVSPTGSTAEVRWYRTNAGELIGATPATADPIVPPASATYVSLFNGGAGNINEARGRFELAL